MSPCASGRLLALVSALTFLVLPAASSPLPGDHEVFDRDGNVIRTADGRSEIPPRPAAATWRDVRGDGPSGAAAVCGLTPMADQVLRGGESIDPCGRVFFGDGSTAMGRAIFAATTALPLTIDRMTTGPGWQSYTPGGNITLLGSAVTYTLSDGSTWSSGAGSYYNHWSQLVSVDVSGTAIRYNLSPPVVGAVYEQTDFDSGNHSSQGKLVAAGPLVIEAQAGSTTAVLHGLARLASNDPTSYGEPRFKYFSAVVGSVVPFDVTYTISGTTWQPDTFTRSFSFSGSGVVDFAHPVSIPKALDLAVVGASRIHGQFTTTYKANVAFDSGVTRNMSTTAVWAVDHPEIASVASGVLTVGALSTERETLHLSATFTWGPDTLATTKEVLCLATDPAERPGTWPMFQANAKHSGYLPFAARPEEFRVRWQATPAGNYALNPVSAGDGKVFVTASIYFNNVQQLFALRTSDGATLWSKGFGSVFSVNPPSYAYGNVFVQTGNHGSDTWLRAFDAESGAQLFQAPHQAQWERYGAPTMYDGTAYVNGGYYGGLYAFEAYTGAQRWYASLPQYDEWTPAVEEVRAFAYLGGYPGLYVKDRLTGVPGAFFVSDPNFGGYTDLTPVIGGHGDVLATNNNRLLSMDPSSGLFAWQLAGAFTGTPSVAKDRVYAIRSGRLVVLDETTDAELWTWQPPSGALAGTMIVTDTHVFASTSTAVYAVDLATHQSAWSYAAGGHLAIADDTLFVAGSSGQLTAIALAVPPTATVAGSTAICPGGSATIQAALSGTPPWTVTWSDGLVQTNVLTTPVTRDVSPSETTTYAVDALSDAVAAGAPAGAAVVTVSPVPETPAPTNDGPACEGSTLHLSTVPVAGATYAWTGPSGFVSASQNPSISNVTTAAAGTYSLVVTVAGCTSAAGTTDVTVNPDDAPPIVAVPTAITIDQLLCCGGGGVTPAESAALSAFLAGGSATDDCDPSPMRLAPRLLGADVTSGTCFQGGTNEVTFGFRDTSGKTGTATSSVTVRMFGDLNLDGVIDSADMVVFQSFFNFAATPGVPPFSAPESLADLTHDGSVDASDMVQLQSYFNFAIACLAP